MILVPKTIKVGYQERNDTYTNKLGYVIYYDEKGKLRKEKSWENWREKKFNPDDFKNEPTSGFVLNRRAGGREESYSSWNTRKTYCRVYDPRGFEFEIDIANLLFILENTNSIVGKGLEGEFVYAWDGTELLLLPVNSPDYKEIKAKSDIIHNKENVKASELVPGKVYENTRGHKLVYAGKFMVYHTNNYDVKGDIAVQTGKKFVFFRVKGDGTFDFEDLRDTQYMAYNWSLTVSASLPRLMQFEDGFHPDFAEGMACLDKHTSINPWQKRVKLVKTTAKDLEELSDDKFIVTKNTPYGYKGVRKTTYGSSDTPTYSLEAERHHWHNRHGMGPMIAKEFIDYYGLKTIKDI
jgi:hypothetical protein